jgi:hypothetical protein
MTPSLLIPLPKPVIVDARDRAVAGELELATGPDAVVPPTPSGGRAAVPTRRIAVALDADVAGERVVAAEGDDAARVMAISPEPPRRASTLPLERWTSPGR